MLPSLVRLSAYGSTTRGPERPCSAVVDFDSQAARAGVAEKFQREPSSPTRDGAGRAPVRIEIAQLRAGQILRWASTSQPSEHFVKGRPETVDGSRGTWELMAEHVLPFPFDLIAEPAVADRLQGRDGDAGVLTFALQHCSDRGGASHEVGMAVQVHDVVKVARPAALGQGTQLLPEQLGDREARHSPDRQGLITVLMPDRTQSRWLGEDLVGGEVELDLRQHTAGRVRTTVGDPALRRGAPAAIVSTPERVVVEDKLDTGLFL